MRVIVPIFLPHPTRLPDGTGAKRFHHHVIGEVTLAHEALELVAEPGLTLTVYTAEPGSPCEQALRLLASWAATQEAEAAVDASAEDRLSTQ